MNNYNSKDEIFWISNNPQCMQIETCYNSLSKRCICKKEPTITTKQSSVEMMWEEIDNLIPYKDEGEAQKFRDLLEKYKAMHKKEMVDFALQCQFNGSKMPGPYFTDDFGRKYNKTFSRNDQQ